MHEKFHNTDNFVCIVNCHYCHKKGHWEAECCTKQHDNTNNVKEEHALMMSYCTHKENSEMWIGDTGATCHMKSTTEWFGKINGSTSTVTDIGNYKETCYVLMEKPNKLLWRMWR